MRSEEMNKKQAKRPNEQRSNAKPSASENPKSNTNNYFQQEVNIKASSFTTTKIFRHLV